MARINGKHGHLISALGFGVGTAAWIYTNSGFWMALVAFIVVVFFSAFPDFDAETEYHRSWVTHSFLAVIPLQLAAYPLEIISPLYSFYAAIGIASHLFVDLIEYPFTETTFTGYALPVHPSWGEGYLVGSLLWTISMVIPGWLYFVIVTGMPLIPL